MKTDIPQNDFLLINIFSTFIIESFVISSKSWTAIPDFGAGSKRNPNETPKMYPKLDKNVISCHQQVNYMENFIKWDQEQKKLNIIGLNDALVLNMCRPYLCFARR